MLIFFSFILDLVLSFCHSSYPLFVLKFEEFYLGFCSLSLQAGTNIRYTPTTQIIYNVQEKKLTMYIQMEKEGCFQATVSYGDVRLKNGDFSILVLNSKQQANNNNSSLFFFLE